MTAPAASAAPVKRLYRSRTDRTILGVCGGLAKYLEVDPTVVRIVWVVATLLLALVGGIVVYLVWALIVPEEPATAAMPLAPTPPPPPMQG